ncbi:MAG TPA: hypothetical protein VNG33_20085 [Polyangiaceae bacterium]|nr:hypothetical protein [Polyangiaceae bacterium]
MLLSAATTFSLVTASGCGTDAVGVDDCREIEQARCEADQPCGVIEDVDACKRYYRDHCLHGLATKPPAGASVSTCVKVIEAAGRCAKADPATKLVNCDPAVTAPHPGLSRACDVVTHPELADECVFLLNTPPVTGAAGESSSGGQPAVEPTPSSAGQAGATGGAAP